MLSPTPSINQNLPVRAGDFATLTEALNYAAQGETGYNFYGSRGDLIERLTYRELAEQARTLARKLIASGFQAGDRIALIAETHGDFARVFFAAQYAGLIPVPLPLPAAFGGRAIYVEQLRRQIETSGAVAVFGPKELGDFVNEAVMGLDAVRLNGTVDALSGVADQGTELPAVSAHSLCYLQFSSGSTRFPLAVAVTQAAMMSNASAIQRHGLQIVRGDRCVSWLPLYHDMGLVGFMLTPMACQMSCDYLASRDFARRPLLWLDLISRNRGTLSYSPSFGYELCARRARTASVDALDLSSWRCAGIGGDMIRAHVLSEFVERFGPHGFKPTTFVPSYGMAETVLAISFAPLYTGFEVDPVELDAVEQGEARQADPSNVRKRDFVLCGRPLPGHDVEIRDGRTTIRDERRIGRIYARGPSVMKEYFQKPDETAAAFSEDGWLDTGDLGYWLRGQLVITGRIKDLIIVNGRNIWPQDLEWTAEQADTKLGNGDIAAVSVEEDGMRERVILLVQCRMRAPAERAELRQKIAGNIQAAHGVECDVVLVPPHGLPQTSSGKLSRARARQNYLNGDYDEPPVSADAASA